MERRPSGTWISCQPVIRNSGRKKHESHVMMKAVELFETGFQPVFGNPCCLRIGLLPGVLIQQPLDPAPEPVGPPVQSVVLIPVPILIRPVVVISVRIRCVGNALPVLLTDPCDLLPDLFHHLIRPCSAVFHFAFLHIFPRMLSIYYRSCLEVAEK